MPTPSENLRPLSTGERFALLVSYVVEVMPQYGYSGNVINFVLAQAALETDRFRSDLFLRADNAFGMRIASQRPQPRIGESNGYAVYATLRDSVADYFDRQRAFNIPNTDDAAEYINATVASGYAEAGHYDVAWMGLLEDVAATDFATAFRLDDVPGDDVPVAEAGSDGIGLLLLLLVGYKMLS
jgi:hypothetical protein